MNDRDLEIPESAIEIQTGLYLYERTAVIGGETRIFRELYSSEGYCFKDMADEVEDESIRTYYRHMYLGIGLSSWSIEQINAQFISVPLEDWMRLANNPNNNEIA